MKRNPSLLALFAVTAVIAIACSAKNIDEQENSVAIDGKNVYTKYCIVCHGADGKLEMNGAKDITLSTLSLEERKALIKSGKNLMTPFEGILSEAEIAAVAEYTTTLK